MVPKVLKKVQNQFRNIYQAVGNQKNNVLEQFKLVGWRRRPRKMVYGLGVFFNGYAIKVNSSASGSGTSWIRRLYPPYPSDSLWLQAARLGQIVERHMYMASGALLKFRVRQHSWRWSANRTFSQRRSSRQKIFCTHALSGSSSFLQLRPSLGTPRTLKPWGPQALEPQNPQVLKPWAREALELRTLKPWNLEPLKALEPKILKPWGPQALRAAAAQALQLQAWGPQALRPRAPEALEPQNLQALGPSGPEALELQNPQAFGTSEPSSPGALKPLKPWALEALEPQNPQALKPWVREALELRTLKP